MSGSRNMNYGNSTIFDGKIHCSLTPMKDIETSKRWIVDLMISSAKPGLKIRWHLSIDDQAFYHE